MAHMIGQGVTVKGEHYVITERKTTGMRYLFTLRRADGVLFLASGKRVQHNTRLAPAEQSAPTVERPSLPAPEQEQEQSDDMIGQRVETACGRRGVVVSHQGGKVYRVQTDDGALLGFHLNGLSLEPETSPEWEEGHRVTVTTGAGARLVLRDGTLATLTAGFVNGHGYVRRDGATVSDVLTIAEIQERCRVLDVASPVSAPEESQEEDFRATEAGDYVRAQEPQEQPEPVEQRERDAEVLRDVYGHTGTLCQHRDNYRAASDPQQIVCATCDGRARDGQTYVVIERQWDADAAIGPYPSRWEALQALMADDGVIEDECQRDCLDAYTVTGSLRDVQELRPGVVVLDPEPDVIYLSGDADVSPEPEQSVKAAPEATTVRPEATALAGQVFHQGWPAPARVTVDGRMQRMTASGEWVDIVPTSREARTFTPEHDTTNEFRCEAGLPVLSDRQWREVRELVREDLAEITHHEHDVERTALVGA